MLRPWDVEWITEGLPNGYAIVGEVVDGQRSYVVVRLKRQPHTYWARLTLSSIFTDWEVFTTLYASAAEAREGASVWAAHGNQTQAEPALC